MARAEATRPGLQNSHQFLNILLIKASIEPIPEWKDEEIDSSSWWEGLQRLHGPVKSTTGGWLCGIAMIQTPITEITTQCFAEIFFLFYSQRFRGTNTSDMIFLKTFFFAQREKNLTCLVCGEQHFLGWSPCISGKLITSKRWWDTAHIAKSLLAGGGSPLKIESVSLRIWSN